MIKRKRIFTYTGGPGEGLMIPWWGHGPSIEKGCLRVEKACSNGTNTGGEFTMRKE